MPHVPFFGRAEQTLAVDTMLARLRDMSDPTARDAGVAAAWKLGASAQQLHDATGLSGEELKVVLLAQGEDPTRRRRGWPMGRRTTR